MRCASCRCTQHVMLPLHIAWVSIRCKNFSIHAWAICCQDWNCTTEFYGCGQYMWVWSILCGCVLWVPDGNLKKLEPMYTSCACRPLINVTAYRCTWVALYSLYLWWSLPHMTSDRKKGHHSHDSYIARSHTYLWLNLRWPIRKLARGSSPPITHPSNIIN